MSKYGNKPTVKNGIKFASKAEERRYDQLELLQRVGEITDLRVHPKYVLQPSFKLNGKTIRAITYEADFDYKEAQNPRVVVEDVKGGRKGKGTRTAVFELKMKMLLFKYPDVEFRIVAA